MSDVKILFFVPEGNVADNGVYASQVLGLARQCATRGARCLIFQYAPGNDLQRETLGEGVSALHDSKVRSYVPFCFQARAYRKIAKQFEKELLDFKPTHIYCRQYQTCLAARPLAKAAGAKLVYSMRGEDISERIILGGVKNQVASWYIRWAVPRAVKACDHLNTVTHAFADWILNKYHKRANVLPCCVEDRAFEAVSLEWRREERLRLGIPIDAQVLVYSGGLSPWQKIDEILALMHELQRRLPTLHLLILTKDQKTLASKCAAAGLAPDRWTGRACKQEEVASYLQLADCGIILRDDTIVNRVASPIKIGEYLAAGLAILASPCIGDVSTDLENQPFARLIRNRTNDDEVDSLVTFIRELNWNEVPRQARAFARSHYTYEGNCDTLEAMFQ